MLPHEQLEKLWSESIGIPPGRVVACSSGSAALHLAVTALEVPVGSAILVPEFTMIACARSVVMSGCIPTFVDCDDELLVSLDECKARTSDATTAIMLVHIYGRRCDEAINAWAKERGLLVIEDCAEFHGPPLSGSADAYCWSFYKNKIVHGDEGGAVAFAKQEHADRARSMRCLGFRSGHNFLHDPGGWNYRLGDGAARAIIPSIRRLDDSLKWRRRIEQMWQEAVPEGARMPLRLAPWVYDIRLPGAPSGFVEEAVRRLGVVGVEARCGFKPMSQQPEFYDESYASLNAARMSRELMYLPIRRDATGIRDRALETLQALTNEYI